MTQPKKQRLSDRLNKDEGAWLKAIGEIGDLARLVFELRKRVEKLEKKEKRKHV